jgi:hypothetical protein
MREGGKEGRRGSLLTDLSHTIICTQDWGLRFWQRK